MFGLLVLYNINLRQSSSHDTYASRFVPISLVRDGDLILDEFVPDHVRRAGPDAVFDNFVLVRGHYYDSHPPIGPIVASPVYAIPVWLGVPANAELAANLLSKLAASLMAACSAWFIFAATRRLLPAGDPASERAALFAALAYGVGTSIWSTASQAMWSHTPAVLAYAAALWSLSAGYHTAAAACAIAAAMSRPATLPAAGLLMLYVVHQAYRTGRREDWIGSARAVTTAILCAAAAASYNLWLLDNPMGGARLRTEIWLRELNAPSMLAGSLPVGLAGLTVSPSYGLFIFSPIVFVAIAGAVRVWRRPAATDSALLMRYASLAALVTLLGYAKFIAWWGGHGFGPRYLTDVMPFAGVLFGWAFAYTSISRAGVARVAAMVLFVYSAAIQAVGAFCWPSPWTLNENPPAHHRLWDWRDNQIMSSIRSGPRVDPFARRLFPFLDERAPEPPASE